MILNIGQGRDPGQASAEAHLLVAAARCWREARDAGAPPLPELSRAFADRDGAMLAPALAGLCSAYEAAIGRPLATGAPHNWLEEGWSDDERRLVELLNGAGPFACLARPPGAAATLRCAVCSTRILLALQ